jgi:hypothetical protein
MQLVPSDPQPFMVELSIHADYYQFYLRDIESACDTAEIWNNPEDTELGLVAGNGLVAISTKRYAHVPVRIEWYGVVTGDRRE